MEIISWLDSLSTAEGLLMFTGIYIIVLVLEKGMGLRI